MSILKVNSIVPANAGSEDYFLARAWVNFDGATAAINDSANVSSLTDTAVGRHVINFSNAFSDSTYGAGLSFQQGAFSSSTLSFGSDSAVSVTTTAYPTHAQSSTGGEFDASGCGGLFLE